MNSAVSSCVPAGYAEAPGRALRPPAPKSFTFATLSILCLGFLACSVSEKNADSASPSGSTPETEGIPQPALPQPSSENAGEPADEIPPSAPGMEPSMDPGKDPPSVPPAGPVPGQPATPSEPTAEPPPEPPSEPPVEPPSEPPVEPPPEPPDPPDAMPHPGTLLYVHAHPDDEGIFGGGVLPYYAQVAKREVVTLGMVTRNPDGSDPLRAGNGTSRVTELQNAVQIYAGSMTTMTNENGHLVVGNITFVPAGLIDTGCCEPKGPVSPVDSWSDVEDGFGWGTSSGVVHVTPGFGNSDGISDGRLAAAHAIARVIRLYRPEVVVSPHDIEGDYGHSNHTATAIGTIDAFELAADESYEIDGLAPWQAQKLYLRGDLENNPRGLTWDAGGPNEFMNAGGDSALFHDGLEEKTLGELSPRGVTNLGLDKHVSQGSFDVSTIFEDQSSAGRLDQVFNGHHSELWTLQLTTVGGDTLEAPFTVPGDTTGRTYTDFARGDFFENVVVKKE